MGNKSRDSDKDDPNGGQVLEVGHVYAPLRADGGSAQGDPVDGVRALGKEEGAGVPHLVCPPPGYAKLDRHAWSSLQNKHLKLAQEGWKPPPRKEKATFFRQKLSGGVKLLDEDVQFCRENVAEIGCAELARAFGMSYTAMSNVVKGVTHRHLNGKFPPQW